MCYASTVQFPAICVIDACPDCISIIEKIQDLIYLPTRKWPIGRQRGDRASIHMETRVQIPE